MVARKKKKKPIVKIELGFGGLLGVTIVSFCIFLWMFLFGVWTGQTVLQNSASQESVKELSGWAEKLWQGNEQPQGVTTAKQKVIGRAAVEDDQNKKGAVDKTASFFSIQVSAFRDGKKAAKAVGQWRARDYKSFFLLPEGPDSTFNRVFVGQFESLAGANSLASKLEVEESGKVFITLVSADQKQYP